MAFRTVRVSIPASRSIQIAALLATPLPSGHYNAIEAHLASVSLIDSLVHSVLQKGTGSSAALATLVAIILPVTFFALHQRQQ